jgi:hypothetical protein
VPGDKKERAMAEKKIVASYLLLLFFHVAHVFEEVWGHFWIMDRMGSEGWYLIINWLLFGLPLIFFYLILNGRRIGYILGILYAIFMVLNGLGHNAAVIVTGSYFGGFAGSISGIGLVLVGIPAALFLRRGLPPRRQT